MTMKRRDILTRGSLAALGAVVPVVVKWKESFVRNGVEPAVIVKVTSPPIDV